MIALKAGFGQVSGWVDGNANCDTHVDATDLAILAGNIGFVAPTAADPGPTFAGLMRVGGIGLLRQRRRPRA